MVLEVLDGQFAVAKLDAVDGVDLGKPYTFLSVTDEEISLVCPWEQVPEDAPVVEAGWRAMRISGVLDFGILGVIADISAVLAENRVSVFVISTYNTDYILVKEDRLQGATDALAAKGYRIT